MRRTIGLACVALALSCGGSTSSTGTSDAGITPGAKPDAGEPPASGPYGITCEVHHRASVYTGDFRDETLHLRTDDPKEVTLSLPDIEMRARVQPIDSDPSIVVLVIDESKTRTTQEYRLPATANVANVFPGLGFTGLIYFYPPGSTVEAQLSCSTEGRLRTNPTTTSGPIRCDVTGSDASGPRTESVQVVGSTTKKITFGTNTVGIIGFQELADQGISIVLQFVPHPPTASVGVESGEVFRQLLQLPPSVSNPMPGANGLSGRFVLHAVGGDISFGCTAE